MTSPMDKRSTGRKRVSLAGRVLLDNGASAIACSIRDLSETGARMLLSRPSKLPGEIVLEIPERELSLPARVAWCTGREYGLTFLDVRPVLEA